MGHLCLMSGLITDGTLSAVTSSGTTTLVPPQCARDLGSPQAPVSARATHTLLIPCQSEAADQVKHSIRAMTGMGWQCLGQLRIWRRILQGWLRTWHHCDLQLIWLTEAARSTRQKHSCIRMNASKMKARHTYKENKRS